MKNETVKLSGWVILEQLDAQGNVVDVIEGPNLITDLGKLNAERLLGGHASGKAITKMAFGTDGTPPTPADTTITGALVKAITATSYASGNTVVFETNIDTGDPAMTVAEVGLYNDDNVLCHRKVFDPPKNKVAGIAYHVTYKVKVI